MMENFNDAYIKMASVEHPLEKDEEDRSTKTHPKNVDSLNRASSFNDDEGFETTTTGSTSAVEWTSELSSHITSAYPSGFAPLFAYVQAKNATGRQATGGGLLLSNKANGSTPVGYHHFSTEFESATAFKELLRANRELFEQLSALRKENAELRAALLAQSRPQNESLNSNTKVGDSKKNEAESETEKCNGSKRSLPRKAVQNRQATSILIGLGRSSPFKRQRQRKVSNGFDGTKKQRNSCSSSAISSATTTSSRETAATRTPAAVEEEQHHYQLQSFNGGGVVNGGLHDDDTDAADSDEAVSVQALKTKLAALQFKAGVLSKTVGNRRPTPYTPREFGDWHSITSADLRRMQAAELYKALRSSSSSKSPTADSIDQAFLLEEKAFTGATSRDDYYFMLALAQITLRDSASSAAEVHEASPSRKRKKRIL